MTPPKPPARWLLVTAALVAVIGIALELARWQELGPWAPELESGALSLPAALPDPNCQALREYFEEEAGTAIEPAALRAAAEVSRVALEARMDGIAQQLDSTASDWRPVFARLALDGPTTVEETLALYRDELARSERFVIDHDLVEVPKSPIRVVEVGNRVFEESFPLALYLNPGTLGVITRAESGSGYLANHCRICVPPLAIHEGVPGHHVAFSLGVPVASNEAARTRINLVFQEGWALYAEVLMGQQGYWVGRAAEELAALRMVLWRATRARVDVDVHCGGLSRAEAEAFYRAELGMTAEAAASELNRHLQTPGNKSSYLVGAQQILGLREALGVTDGVGVTNEQGSLRRFHDRLLRHPRPLPLVAAETFGVALPAFSSAPPLIWEER